MASHRSKSLYAIKECSTCGRLYTKECCSIGSLKDKILVPEPDSSPCCAKCGTPVDGPSCRGCAFLRKKFDEDLLAYCVENGIFQDFQDTSESSDDNTNVVNALREPCVVNQDPGEKSSQGAHFGYNCPPKDPIISKPEPCNQTINEIPQTLPSLDPSCFSLPHVSKPNLVDDPPNVFNLSPQILPIVHPICNYENENSFIYDSKPHSFNVSSSVFNQPQQPQFETYLCELCGNNAHYGYDCPPQFPFVYEQEPKVRKKEQAYEEEKYSAACRYMLSITCDDEDDFIPLGDIIVQNSTSKAITPDLPIEEPDNSLNMGDEHLDTIPATDDDYFEDIEYVSLEEVNEVDQEKEEFDLDDILQIQDVILREKLLNVSRLISNIESLKDNPIPIMDSDSSETSLSFSDNSLPEFESFSDHTEETRSGSTTTHANYSLPEYESFHFDNPSLPRPPPEPPDIEILKPEINNFDVLYNDESFEPRGDENVVVPNVEEDNSFTFVIRTFLPFITYPEVSPLSSFTGSEDTIFDPGIFA
ncbi:hypothetical protein Tco_0733816 [Tanacetum coccineum]